MESPQTVFDAYALFTQQGPAQGNHALINNLRSALRRYVLPSYGFTQIELKKLDVVLLKMPLDDFRNVEETLDENLKPLLDKGELVLGTGRGYKSAILRFLAWLREQGWYPEAPPAPPKDQGKYAPPLRNGPKVKLFQSLGPSRKGKRCSSSVQYALKETELSPRLIRQLEAAPGRIVEGAGKLTKRDFSQTLVKQFQQMPPESLPEYGLHYFLTAKEVPKRKDDPLREVTYGIRRSNILGFLGWLKKYKGWKVQKLCLELMANKELLEEFIAWGINERGNTYAWAGTVAAAGLNIAKWLHHKYSKSSLYKDVEVVVALRDYGCELDKKRRSQGTQIQEEKAEKFLTFEECKQIVAYSRACCAPFREYFHENGSRRGTAKRSEHAVIRAWQNYLIIAILVYCPVRQREIREMELGVNLIRESEGYWVKLTPEGHKVGSKTGRGREYPLPAHLTKDMDEWLTVWRPKIKTEYNQVFVMLGSKRNPEAYGKPYAEDALYKLVTNHTYKVTSFLFDEPKRTNPHFFRNIAITHQRKHGNSQQQEALAELMGHSVAEADRTYSLMTSRDKTSKAHNWWESKE